MLTLKIFCEAVQAEYVAAPFVGMLGIDGG